MRFLKFNPPRLRRVTLVLVLLLSLLCGWRTPAGRLFRESHQTMNLTSASFHPVME